MQPARETSFRPYLSSAILMAVLGLGLGTVAVLAFEPTVWARWLLFFGLTVGVVGLALPVTWFLNLRFPSEPPAGAPVVLRQAIWFGVYGALLAWLQQERLVSIWTGFGLAGGLAAVEYLIRMRERARWTPPAAEPAPPTGARADEPTETRHG